jgi:hypothetical protein
MATAWCTAASLKCKYFLYIIMQHGEMKRTDSVSNASQPRCRSPWKTYVHCLPCRDPRRQVLLWSLPGKSPARKMARRSDKMIYKQNIFGVLSIKLSGHLVDKVDPNCFVFSWKYQHSDDMGKLIPAHDQEKTEMKAYLAFGGSSMM